MIPFAASAARYSDWLRVLLKEDAEKSFPSVKGKEQARTLIEGGMTLSVPVEGGASRLKRECGSEIIISDHGRWQDVHLGALKAHYGKAPYFSHLFPKIERIYKEKSSGPLQDFNLALHQLALQWLGLEDGDKMLIKEIREADSEKRAMLSRLAEESKRNIDMNHSIFNLLFRLGKESLFALL